MLCNDNYIKKLIGFKGFIFENLETTPDSFLLFFSLKVTPHNCHIFQYDTN